LRRAEVMVALGTPMMTDIGPVMPGLDRDWTTAFMTLLRASDGVIRAAINLPARLDAKSEKTLALDCGSVSSLPTNPILDRCRHTRARAEELLSLIPQMKIKIRVEAAHFDELCRLSIFECDRTSALVLSSKTARSERKQLVPTS
jgi:hypothetical protein